MDEGFSCPEWLQEALHLVTDRSVFVTSFVMVSFAKMYQKYLYLVSSYSNLQRFIERFSCLMCQAVAWIQRMIKDVKFTLFLFPKNLPCGLRDKTWA